MVLLRKITRSAKESRVSQSAVPVPCCALVPEVLPTVMPDLPAVPEVLPAPAPGLVLPERLPIDLPAEGRAALAAALDGSLPGGPRQDRGELVREAVPSCWDDAELARLRGFLRAVDDLRGRQGRVYPLEYLLALPLIAGMAGDGELDAVAENCHHRRSDAHAARACPAGRGRRRLLHLHDRGNQPLLFDAAGALPN
jgi:hypothetical protein